MKRKRWRVIVERNADIRPDGSGEVKSLPAIRDLSEANREQGGKKPPLDARCCGNTCLLGYESAPSKCSLQERIPPYGKN